MAECHAPIVQATRPLEFRHSLRQRQQQLLLCTPMLVGQVAYRMREDREAFQELQQQKFHTIFQQLVQLELQ